MKLSVSLNAALPGTDRSTAEKIALAASIGYKAAELWGWWDEDLEALAAASEKHGVAIGSICTRFVSLVEPAERERYLLGLEESIAAAQRIGCRYLISQTGQAIAGRSREAQTASLIEGLQAAGKLLEGTGITLVVEPLNTRVDHPGYFLVHAEEAASIIREAASPNVRLLYDVYHQQVSEGDLIRTIRSCADVIAYYHIADHPGRHEPGTGEIHYANVLQAIKATGYDGYVGLEYFPSSDAVSALEQVFRSYGSLQR